MHFEEGSFTLLPPPVSPSLSVTLALSFPVSTFLSLSLRSGKRQRERETEEEDDRRTNFDTAYQEAIGRWKQSLRKCEPFNRERDVQVK